MEEKMVMLQNERREKVGQTDTIEKNKKRERA